MYNAEKLSKLVIEFPSEHDKHTQLKPLKEILHNFVLKKTIQKYCSCFATFCYEQRKLLNKSNLKPLMSSFRIR